MRKKTSFLAGAIVCVTAAALFVPRVRGAEDIKAQIEAANKAFCAAFEKHDADAVANSYTADAMLFPTGQDVVSGHDAIRAYWKAGMEGIGRVTLTTLEAEQHGDTAIEVGRVEIFDAQGKTLDVAKYIVIWKRIDGNWKLHRDIFNTNLPAAH